MHHSFCSGYLITTTCITYQPRTSSRSSQDQIKLGINNTVVIIKWPQGAWCLPTILAQHHEYSTSRYPRYHGDYLDHERNHSWFNGLPRNQTVIIPAITTMTNTWSQTVIFPAITTNMKMVYPPSSYQQCNVHKLVCKIYLSVDPWCDLL